MGDSKCKNEGTERGKLPGCVVIAKVVALDENGKEAPVSSVLAALLADGRVEFRRYVAANPATSDEDLLALARDKDDTVRTLANSNLAARA